MKLEDMPTKELLALHNRIADKPAGPKTFSTRAKLVARIEQIARGVGQRAMQADDVGFSDQAVEIAFAIRIELRDRRAGIGRDPRGL